MRLKRLELFGFKSFADRTVIEFDRSLVGIVGPNGCGKSNVVDAMRWVLGETRPTSMRGSGMTDVIFKGSASRPPMSVAEVTLVLDNADDRLEGRGAEASITRRVDQGGEGEYLIAGQRVRLKDVRDMLFDTGLGSRGYAVLEQGKIDAVLSANPLERRAIFEEAAGISRYRQRKKEAESRLRRAEQDVTRLDDVIKELGSRVRSLKLQAGKAERYLRVRAAWESDKLRLVRHRARDLEAELGAIRAELAADEAVGAELRGRRQAGESERSARELAGADLSGRVDAATQVVSSLSGDVRALDERQRLLEARAESARAAAAEETERALDLERVLGERRAEGAALAQRAAAAREERDAAERHLRGGEEALREVRARYRETRDASQAKNDQVLELLHEKTAAANARRHLEGSRAGLEERSARAARKLDEARGRADELRGAAEEAEARLGVERAAEEHAAARLLAARAELARLETAAEGLLEHRKRLELERARLSSRLAALRDWEREREGLSAGTRAALEGLAAGDGPCAADAVRGLLADHLRTSTRLARALDAVLGERALALVARTPEAAVEIVRWLAERRDGHAHVLVPEGLARRRPPELPEWPPELAARVEGRLVDHVQASEGCEALAELLVGDVIVVADRATGRELVRRYPRLRCATPEGDLVDACGLTGGHREIAQGAVGRRSSAVELERDAARLEAELAALEARLRVEARRRAELAARSSACEEERERRRGFVQGAASEAHAARARLADLEAGLEGTRSEAERAAHELVELERGLERAAADLADAEARFRVENEALAALERERHELESERERLSREDGAAQVEHTRVLGLVEAAEQRLHDLERLSAQSAGELDRARVLARQHAEAADAAAAESAGLREERAALAERLEAARAELAELRAAESHSREALSHSRVELDALTRELEDVLARVAERRLDEQRLALSRGELLARAAEQLGRAPEELLEGFEPEPELSEPGAMDALESAVEEARRELDRLGPVNTEALRELEEIEGRHEFLTGERVDLEESRRSLERTIAAINEESRRRFLDTFDVVRGNFLTLFRQLFGGGRADLELVDPSDPLETGIEIVARPPGREMLPIGLLSGGQRTMTALALLFAVFQAQPSPFCVLDEVDAALDDANVGRFLAMLEGFRATTQFVVVTHNKGTMSACEALYGITMETRGVSRHVTVELEEVDHFVPEATGNAGAAADARDAVLERRPPADDAADDDDAVLVPVPRAAAGGRAPASAPGAGANGHGEEPSEPPSPRSDGDEEAYAAAGESHSGSRRSPEGDSA